MKDKVVIKNLVEYQSYIKWTFKCMNIRKKIKYYSMVSLDNNVMEKKQSRKVLVVIELSFPALKET